MRILIVDDEKNIREGLVETINWKDYGIDKVLATNNGYAALEILKKARVDIMIADIKMPGINGLELTERVNECYPEIKVILLSGYSEFEYAKRAITLGVEDYLLKPVKIVKLVNTVEKLCAKIKEEKKKKQMIGYSTDYTRKDNGTAEYCEPVKCSAFIEKCKEYLQENFSNDIRLEDLSTYVGKNTSYISHVFKKETGMSFSEYLNKIRIKMAMELMERSSMLIYEIAESVGYSDYRYFTYVFKKYTGRIPSEYRSSSVK